MLTWTVNDEKFESIPDNARSFIYKITYIGEGKFKGFYYIGSKVFYHKRTVNKTKKEISAQKDKRLSKKKKTIKESNWKSYMGSCTNLEYKKLIQKNPNLFKREILYIIYNTDKWTEKYYEKKFMILENWESEKCFNGNFEGKTFK